MNKSKAFFVLSRYSEDVSWITEYTDDYIIYNKGTPIGGCVKELILPNIGNNQRDIFEFIYLNYENLPDFIVFIQAYPFDHCKKEKFDKIIYNETFTPLESYEDIKESSGHKKSDDGQYMERNDSWYINCRNNDPLREVRKRDICKYSTFDEFMHSIFIDYQNLEWIRFSPGSQYLIEKKNALYYPRSFWKHLMNILCKNDMTEGHILERAMWLIFINKYKIRESIIEAL